MKLKEYKELINSLPESLDNAEVIISKDSEGNGFSPFSDLTDNALYNAETTWYGEAYCRDSYDDEEWEEKCSEDVTKCIILWPIN